MSCDVEDTCVCRSDKACFDPSCRTCPMCAPTDFDTDDVREQSQARRGLYAFRAKYGDRVLEVMTFDNAVVELWTCAKCGEEQGYAEDDLMPLRPDGTRGHYKGPFIDGDPTGECAGPVDGPVKGF